MTDGAARAGDGRKDPAGGSPARPGPLGWVRRRFGGAGNASVPSPRVADVPATDVRRADDFASDATRSDLGIVLVGGSGRSGTSIFTGCLNEDDRIAAFPDLELKLTAEADGFVDLYRGFVSDYAPSKAARALGRFEDAVTRHSSGRYGQRRIDEWIDEQRLGGHLAGIRGQLEVDGVACMATPEQMSAIIRPWLIGLYSKAGFIGPQTALVLEKTPHSLLQRRVLDRLLHPVRFIHVTRDPRSVAHSLLRVGWGPGTVDGAVTWVRQYHRRYASEADPGTSAPVLELRIEDVAREPVAAAAAVSAHIGLDLPPAMFARITSGPLNDWVDACDRDLLAKLQDGLGAEAVELGYSDRDIGVVVGGAGPADD